MANSDVQAAIIALLTAGVLLLNLGVDLVKQRAFDQGVVLCMLGALFIVVAVILISVLAERAAKRVAYGVGRVG